LLSLCSEGRTIRKKMIDGNDLATGDDEPLRVLSIILKLEMLLRKSEALGA